MATLDIKTAIEKSPSNDTELNNKFEFYGIVFSIDNVEPATMVGGINAYIIYLKIANKTVGQETISLTDITYITQSSEQINLDIWLTGYMIKEANIRQGAYQQAGLVFYSSKLKEINDGDRLCLTACLFSKKLTICFIKNGDYWEIEETQTKIILTAKQLTEKVERFETFEEKCNVEIKNISFVQRNGITCYVEVISTGAQSRDDVHIEAILYDTEGDIIIKKCRYMKFEGFGVFEFTFFDIDINNISKIRIYPTT